MTAVRKTVTLTQQQDQWIKSQIVAGHYANDSELVRDLIRREQQRSVSLDAVQAALIAGEASGEPQPFDPAGFLSRMRATHG